ncbi:hypothetical protein HELRODRAFT_180098 [Helobdella robusta]|uniref:Uncharacterized protein n=1 Tax=Helobdella robusta TaxID=6412 RepID=T1FFG9_HELRO|nr:hypothetical protein HELRODRAFT_180098 [Helobdella robusta]ESN94766.1 hypothetical protein HELRODRAFT_180098 [Helobdella robusta]
MTDKRNLTNTQVAFSAKAGAGKLRPAKLLYAAAREAMFDQKKESSSARHYEQKKAQILKKILPRTRNQTRNLTFNQTYNLTVPYNSHYPRRHSGESLTLVVCSKSGKQLLARLFKDGLIVVANTSKQVFPDPEMFRRERRLNI